MRPSLIVIKIGTAILSEPSGRLDALYIDGLVSQVCQLLKMGHKVVLVSSGAVGAGVQALGLKNRPRQLEKLQACAAIGQSRLMRLYEDSFSKRGLHTAQLLLTQDDFSSRKRFLNARNTMLSLLNEFGSVPVINENDTIATEEIKLGDNDRLSALVAHLVEAHTLIMLTDVDGLYSPKDKKLIPLVARISHEIEGMAGPSAGRFGIGGMASKLRAVKTAMHAGITCIIANGRTGNVLLRIVRKEPTGTTFSPGKDKRTKARKNWLAFSPKPKGAIAVDRGARSALVSGNKSLLPAGIKAVSGRFDAGDVISITGPDSRHIAKGVVNFSSAELNMIKGLKTAEIGRRLHRDIAHHEVVHKDNLAILI